MRQNIPTKSLEPAFRRIGNVSVQQDDNIMQTSSSLSTDSFPPSVQRFTGLNCINCLTNTCFTSQNTVAINFFADCWPLIFAEVSGDEYVQVMKSTFVSGVNGSCAPETIHQFPCAVPNEKQCPCAGKKWYFSIFQLLVDDCMDHCLSDLIKYSTHRCSFLDMYTLICTHYIKLITARYSLHLTPLCLSIGLWGKSSLLCRRICMRSMLKLFWLLQEVFYTLIHVVLCLQLL